MPYTDSGGLGELVRCLVITGKASCAVTLINLTSKSNALLAITKLSNVFDTFDSESAATASLQ